MEFIVFRRIENILENRKCLLGQNIVKENVRLDFGKKIDQTKGHISEKTRGVMSMKHKKFVWL